MAWRTKVGELEASQFFHTTTKLSGLAHLCGGGQRFSGSANAEWTRRAQVGPHLQLTTCSSALTPASPQGPAALDPCGPATQRFGLRWRRTNAASPAWKWPSGRNFRPQFRGQSTNSTTRHHSAPASPPPLAAALARKTCRPLGPASIQLTRLERAHPQNGAPVAYNKTSVAGAASWWQSNASVSAPTTWRPTANLGNPVGRVAIGTTRLRRHGHRSDRYGASSGASPRIYSTYRPAVDWPWRHPFTAAAWVGGTPPVAPMPLGLSGYLATGQTPPGIPRSSAGWGSTPTSYDSDQSDGAFDHTSQRGWWAGRERLPSLRAMPRQWPWTTGVLPPPAGRRAPQTTAISAWEWWYKVKSTDNIFGDPSALYLSRLWVRTHPRVRAFRQLGGARENHLPVLIARLTMKLVWQRSISNLVAARSTNLHNQISNGSAGKQPLKATGESGRSNRRCPATVIWPCFQVDKSGFLPFAQIHTV